MNLINTIDTIMYNLIIELMSNGTTAFMMFVSHLGSAVVLITLAIAFLVLVKNKKDSRCIALNLVLVFLLNRILKFIIARPRPEILRLVPEEGYSFPSGHAMVSMGFYGFLIYLIYTKIKSEKLKYSLITFLGLLILFIGISRIYLGVHYFTDVIGGFVIAVIYLHWFIKNIYNKKRGQRRKNGRNI